MDTQQHTDMRDEYEFALAVPLVDDTPRCADGKPHDFTGSGRCSLCHIHRGGDNQF